MKKVLLDTSVLVAATLSEHEHHQVALPWLSKAHRDDFELLVAGHSIAEMFSLLTRYPLRPRLSPSGAARIIRESVKSKARIVALTPTGISPPSSKLPAWSYAAESSTTRSSHTSR